jgi:hypothetical protein
MSNAVPERLTLGWCKPCYTHWRKHRSVNQQTGTVYWSDEHKTYVSRGCGANRY